MGFTFDSYGNLKQSKMFLANPQKNYVGVIHNAESIKLTKCLTNMYELEFKIYEKINNIYTENYYKIQKPRLIEVKGIGWFQIVNAPEKQDENSCETYKEVRCCQLENVLVYRKIYNISGTFALYDNSDMSHSLLHIICAECGWSIGHVSNSLLGKWRTFSIDSMQIYNLLTTSISESFDCCFTFNSYEKTINAYTINEIGEKTNILISKKNILREWVKDDTDNAIITKIRVKGGDDNLGGNVDIRAINFGRDYLTNLDYFMNTDWVSQDLINAYNLYKTACSNALTSYNSAITTLKTKQSELLVLQTSLVDLESQKSAQEKVIGVSIQLHSGAPISSDSDYTTYQNAVTLKSTYITQIASKKADIALKTNEIATVQSTIDSISSSIDESNFFTEAQLAELNLFITENEDYQDETFIITDTMSESEVIDMKLELKENAAKELARISQPQYTITIKASSIFTIQDNKDALISYKSFIEKFDVGNIITIKLRDDYWIEARLMKMTLDFDNLEDLDLVFTNKNKLEDELIELGELLADAGRTASSYSLKYFGYKKASEQSTSVREFMNGSLNATNNRVFSDSNIQTELSQYGIINRKWLSDQNKYDDRQTLLTQNVLLFTDDNWKSSKAGIGYFTNSNNETYYGVLADVICGQLIMGEQLTITNSSGNYSINDSGFTATAKVGTNTYLVGINPSTPSDIFNIKVNGVDKLYVDTTNNRLVMTGEIQSTVGNIGGWSIASDGLSNSSLNASINLFNGTNKTMKLAYNGLHYFLPSNNEYLGSLLPSYNSTDGTNGLCLVQSPQAEYIAIGYTDSTSSSAGNITIGLMYNHSQVTIEGGTYTAGVNLLCDINMQYKDIINCSKINGGYPITEYNKNNYTYPPDESYLSSYATQSWVSQNYQSKGSYLSGNGVSGYFTTNDGKTIYISNGLVVSIV